LRRHELRFQSEKTPLLRGALFNLEHRDDSRRARSRHFTTKGRGGTMQWAYDGKPLYFYADDKKKGETAGDGKGGVWHIVKE
jgi:predicted lipoprotein with Yx(FWY)xxD motif